MYNDLSALCPSKVSVTRNSDSFANLSRHVFDELLETDLLGFLLSSKHFEGFIKSMTFADGSSVGQIARDLFSSDDGIRNFHNATLNLYCGVYIAECCHKSQENLMRDLDAKWLLHKQALNITGMLCAQKNLVELSWKYRRECSGERNLII
jgi:hypothetical protein